MTKSEKMEKAKRVAAVLKTMFGEEAEFVCRDTVRSNEELMGIALQMPGLDVLPVAYLEEMPEDTSVEEFANFAAVKFQAYLRSSLLYRVRLPEMSRENILKNVFLQALARDRNLGIVEEKACFEQLDLIGVYRMPVGQMKEGLASMMLPKELPEEVHLTQAELRQAASRNTVEKFGIVVLDARRFTNDYLQGRALQEIPFPKVKMNRQTMYSLTNRIQINGAGLILIPEVLEAIREKTGRDYFILPSSIHEVQILPDDGSRSADSLKQVICDANRNFVGDERSMLTDSLYYYSRRTGMLTML